MLSNVEKVKQKILPVLHRHRVRRAGLFGSIIRGEMKKDSDIDILVEIDNDISLIDFIGIKQEIEDILGRSVDLVEYQTLKPAIKKSIIEEQLIIL